MNLTIKANSREGKIDYLQNLFSGFKTGIIGVVLGIIGLIAFIYSKGGETYLDKLSETFFFGKDNNIIKYCSILFFEGIASSLIGAFALMQYWKDVKLKPSN